MYISRRKRVDPKQLETESSFYDVYNNMAEAYDAEMIKDWSESLNFLLVFAAIFSAVLTAFIVESIQLLQEDPQDVTVDILISLTNQLANGTFTGYSKPTFKAPTYAVIVNCLFFASIGNSLFAALAAVIALQWVGQYDARLDTADPRKLALVRQARFMGVDRWRMSGIISGLPILLYISVFLFFSGMVEWMWNIHRVVGAIVVIGAASALGFCVITASTAVFFPGSPYRSKISQWIATGLRWLLALAKKCIYTAVGRRDSLGSIHSYILEWLPDTSKWENAVIQRTDLQISAVMWAVKHVNRSPQFYRRLLHIAKYACQLDIKDDREATELRNIPWKEVFRSIRAHITSTPAESASVVTQDTNIFLECIADHLRFGMDDAEKEASFYNPVFEDAERETVGKLYLWRSSNDKESFTKLWEGLLLGVGGVTHSRRTVTFAIEQLADFISKQGPTELSIKYLNMLPSAIQVDPKSDSESLLLPDTTLRAVLKAMHAVASNDKDDVCWSESTYTWRFFSHPTDSFLLTVDAVLSQYLAQLWRVNSQNDGEDLLWRIHKLLLFHRIAINHNFLFLDMAEKFIVDVRYSPLYDHNTGTLKEVSVARMLICLLSSEWCQSLVVNSLAHDLMEGFLSFRLRFPSSPPVWGPKISYEQTEPLNHLYNRYLYEQRASLQYNLPYSLEKLKANISVWWSSSVVDFIRRCDDLIASGCTQEQRSVIVKLIAANLSPYDLIDYPPYSTTQELKDPCLSLITTRLGESFSRAMPSGDEIIQIGPGWVIALKYWCDMFKELNSVAEKRFLREGLLSQNNGVQRAIVAASSNNEALKSVIQDILGAAAQDNHDEMLRLYAACRRASWFTSYMRENDRWESALVICSRTPLSNRTITLLSILSPFADNEASWRKLAKVLIDSITSGSEEFSEGVTSRLVLAIQTAVDSYLDPSSILPEVETQFGEGLEELILEGIMFMLAGQEEGAPRVNTEDEAEVA